ncbi:hypothetical protein PVAP13_6KG332206 [Panicum virgatum]|uniref:Uncharacterized protein n=1 Tax=Panicum virgatum TaxID=38727 RepID=A0A8T0RGT6_PANVG|nr:hypothetical protein PVAP13_6KG332206 [Panicum virgatum]
MPGGGMSPPRAGPRSSRECPGHADAAGCRRQSSPGQAGPRRLALPPAEQLFPTRHDASSLPTSAAAAAACGRSAWTRWGCCSARVSAGAVILATVPSPFF